MRPLIKLYYAPNTISVAVAISLEESRLDYTTQHVDFSRNEQLSATYTAINPKGRVPALGTNDGILTETGAILDCPSSGFLGTTGSLN